MRTDIPRIMMAELRFFVTPYTSTQMGIGAASMIRNPFRVRMLFPILHTRLARKRIMASFATSAGCSETPMTFSHLLAPFFSIPSGVSTSRISTTDTKYPSAAKRSQK